MLEPLLESTLKEKVLLFLLLNDGSYPSEIARHFAFNINAVQFQLKKLENAGVLYSDLRGKVRLYGLDPRYPYIGELAALLRRAFASLGPAEKRKFAVNRQRQTELTFAAAPAATDDITIEKEIPVEDNGNPSARNEPLDFSID
jgi:DNA-binding transcriptional ArsR family regulator